MERPAKRQKLSSSDWRVYPTSNTRQHEELSCTHADGKTEGSGGRLIVPTPTLHQHDLRRRFIPDGSSNNAPNQLPPAHAAAPIVPRTPDTTVIATAVDVNVQNGNTTIANTLLLQASDATVVSFTSLGVLTVPAQTTAPTTATSGTATSGLLRSSESSSDASLPAGSLSSSTSPTLSLPPGYNSSATSTSDRTTTITLTSTLNVSFLNGTVVTLPNASETTASATLTSSTDGPTDIDSTLTSPTSALSNLTPAGATGSADNGASAAAPLGGAGSGSPTTAVASATSSSSSFGGSALGPATPAVVGGVVGGVAGVAFLLLIFLALLRWYRKRLQSRGQLPEQIAARSATGGPPSGANQTSSQSSHSPFTAAILSSTRRWRPQSSTTTATAVTDYTTVPDSERGFQRIAGRKIAPVIGSGSDQYGGNYGAFEKDFPEGRLTRDSPSGPQARTPNKQERDLADSSFYRDSQGFYGGRGEPLPASPTLVSSSMGHTRGSTRDLTKADSIGDDLREGALEGYAVMRPSPARTPMTSSPSTSSLRLPIQQGPIMDPGAPPTPALPLHLIGRRQDDVGRSLASLDGSRGSRFTESV
jgi:hypothetical protein